MDNREYNKLLSEVRGGRVSVYANLEYDEAKARIDSDVEVTDGLSLHIEGYAYGHKELEYGNGYSPTYTEVVLDSTDIDFVFPFAELNDDIGLTAAQELELIEALNNHLRVEL